jgi:hypothetical protein
MNQNKLSVTKTNDESNLELVKITYFSHYLAIGPNVE